VAPASPEVELHPAQAAPCSTGRSRRVMVPATAYADHG